MKNYQENLISLRRLLGSMDLPAHRKVPKNNDCLRWLAKCIAERNSGHPKFTEATELLKELGHTVRV